MKEQLLKLLMQWDCTRFWSEGNEVTFIKITKVSHPWFDTM